MLSAVGPRVQSHARPRPTTMCPAALPDSEHRRALVAR
ncbi:hypothetical protein FTUN_1343 [Frigoriglobus tundricola]|uniref:Uncharacterized protein n=1 Tax=Frigoriglobus tundricola TaxID=2774151 RepID=A0A6M5YLG2_9BACT|nr:hypothetical protein FTUN_1343 [Frigoriglobus tundricola]